MSLVWTDQPAAVDHERSIICAVRPVVDPGDKLRARRHEYELAEGRRQRNERRVDLLIGAWAAVGAVALAVVILWGVR